MRSRLLRRWRRKLLQQRRDVLANSSWPYTTLTWPICGSCSSSMVKRDWPIRRRWSAAFHRAAAPDATPAPTIFITGQRQLMLQRVGIHADPMEESSNASSSTGFHTRISRSDPHDPALTGCSSHHNPVRHVVAMTIAQLAANPDKEYRARSFAIARSRPLASRSG